MKSLARSLQLLSDETRLRALRVLLREELNAGELARVVGVGKSTISRHLAALRDAGLVQERRQGRYAWFKALETAADGDGEAWSHVRALVEHAEDDAGDLARLDDVLRTRREREHGVDGASRRPFVPGRSWAAWARALGALVPSGLRVVDLGCGEGALTFEIARFAGRVTGVDRREPLLAKATERAEKSGLDNVVFRRADLRVLPYDDGAFDVALLSQSLHFVEEPAEALAEAARVVAPGGHVLVLDLMPHSEEWVRERLGHHHMGFALETIEELLAAAGLVQVRVEPLPSRAEDPFHPLLASGIRAQRPGGAS